MNSTKADFRTLRELTGITQSYLAELMDVEPRSVRRWENVDAQQFPPVDAWRIVKEARKRQMMEVGLIIDQLSEFCAEDGTPGEVTLPYYPTQEAYCADHEPDDLNYLMANANMRLAAHEAELMGYAVRLEYA